MLGICTKEPRISGFIDLETRCQASPIASESTESIGTVADQLQSRAAAWRFRRPRVAVALTAQATPRPSAPSSRQRPPALSHAPFSLHLGLLRHPQRPQA